MQIVVLGAGMVGSAIAIDLSKSLSVTAADINQEALDKLLPFGINCRKADLSDLAVVQDVISDADMVVNAVPGFMGYKTLETIILSGKNVVDIAFFPEDSSPLDKLAREKGVIAVTDMGVAPGMCNVIFGYHYSRMQISSYLCLVGGLPKKRIWPWEYKAPFSPCDVIEEYVRPARYRENGEDVVRPALSDPELVSFDKCGTLETWNSDGLRSLLHNMPDVPNMKEKTMRWPGHIEKARILRESGFFSNTPISIKGTKISPLEMTEKLLFSSKNWKLDPEEEEFTVMRVIIEGDEDGKFRKYIWNLYDEYNHQTKTSSMARTTGYACTAAVNAVISGLYTEMGLSPAEFLGRDEDCFKFLLNYLKDRGVIYKESELEE